MLDILRKHARSWFIKLALAAIVITFIFFFGYSSMRSGPTGRSGEGKPVATVNGMPIPFAEYKFVLDNTFESMRASFEGKEVPDFVRTMAESTALRQLVQRELLLQQADELGVTIPDAQLAKIVRETPAAQRNGSFDPEFYRHQYLPFFKSRFGIEYEDFVRQDLIIGTLTNFFQNINRLPPEDDKAKDVADDTFTFEVITIDPKALIEAEQMKSREEAVSLAEMLIKANPASWGGMLRTFKIAPEKVGPIGIDERLKLAEGKVTFEDSLKIFSLSTENPIIAAPLERDEKLYVVRLISKKISDKAPKKFWPEINFFQSWINRISQEAKVVSFLDAQQ